MKRFMLCITLVSLCSTAMNNHASQSLLEKYVPGTRTAKKLVVAGILLYLIESANSLNPACVNAGPGNSLNCYNLQQAERDRDRLKPGSLQQNWAANTKIKQLETEIRFTKIREQQKKHNDAFRLVDINLLQKENRTDLAITYLLYIYLKKQKCIL